MISVVFFTETGVSVRLVRYVYKSRDLVFIGFVRIDPISNLLISTNSSFSPELFTFPNNRLSFSCPWLPLALPRSLLFITRYWRHETRRADFVEGS